MKGVDVLSLIFVHRTVEMCNVVMCSSLLLYYLHFRESLRSWFYFIVSFRTITRYS